MKRALRWIVWGSLIAILFFGGLKLSIEQATANTHRQLLQIATGDNFYRGFVTDYFHTYSIDSRSISINETYHADRVNVLVIEVSSERRAELAPYVRNIVAVGQNVIVIDRELFDLFLTSANYAFKAGLADQLARDTLEVDFGPFGTLMLWAQQYTAILRDMRDGGDMLREQVRQIKQGIKAQRSRRPEDIPPELRKFPIITTSIHMHTAAFGVLMEHEFAHLEIGPVRRILLRTRSMLTEGFQATSRYEEELVDQIALARLDETMRRMHTLMPIEDTRLELSVLYANFLFFWNDGMFDFFENRRGLVAEDFLIEINFDECHMDPAMLEIVPDKVFGMVSALRKARLKPLPVLDDTEYGELQRMVSSSRSHSHSAIRAERLLARIAVLLEADLGTALDVEEVGLLPDTIGLDSETYASHVSSLSPLSLDLASLRADAATAKISFRDGRLCPEATCLVAHDEFSVVEIVANEEERVMEVRASMRPGYENAALVPLVLRSVLEGTDIPEAEVFAAMEDVRSMCPGYFTIVAAEESNDLVYIAKMATPDFVLIRSLKPK